MSDVSSVTNHFPTINEGFSTALDGSILSGATTVPLTGVSDLTNGKPFVGIIEPGEEKQQVFTGTVDTANSEITDVVWTRGTNVGHASGVTIVDYVTGTHLNMITKGILEFANQEGELLTTAVVEDRGTLTNFAPAGMLAPYAGTSAPTGWLLCYGQAVSRTTYADLFAAISTTYGVGDGSTTFNLPDLRGRTIAGQDNMGGSSANRLTDIAGSLDGDTLGDTGGRENTRHTFLSPPINTSSFQDGGTAYLTSAATDMNTWLAAGDSSSVTRSTAVRNVGGTIGTNGTTGTEVGHYQYTAPNIQPTIILNYIIRT